MYIPETVEAVVSGSARAAAPTFTGLFLIADLVAGLAEAVFLVADLVEAACLVADLVVDLVVVPAS